MISISVIVPVHYGGQNFTQCLQAISRSKRADDQLIVVADGKIKSDCEIAAHFGAMVVGIGQRSGPAAARNEGAAVAGRDVLFFVDSDVIVAADTIERLRTIFERDDWVTAVIGSYDDDPGAPNFLSQYRNLQHHYIHQTSQPLASTFWGACGAIRRVVFESYGGFDVSYDRPSVEDIELGYRLAADNHVILLDKDLQVSHLKRWNARTMVTTDMWRRAYPWAKLILRDGRLNDDLNVTVDSRLSALFIGATFFFLILAKIKRPFAMLAAGATAVAIYLNRDFYGFLREKRGLAFTLLAIPWHWLYYLYSSLMFVVAAAMHFVDPSRRRSQRR